MSRAVPVVLCLVLAACDAPTPTRNTTRRALEHPSAPASQPPTTSAARRAEIAREANPGLAINAPARDPRAPIETKPDGTRVFGRRSTLTSATPLGDVLREPRRFDGRSVRTEGVVAEVCQSMGCWMEIRASDDAGRRVHVRMYGHSFFLPRDVVGHRAVTEGRLGVRALSPNEVAHLRGEGSSVTEGSETVELEATTVEVLPDGAAG